MPRLPWPNSVGILLALALLALLLWFYATR